MEPIATAKYIISLSGCRITCNHRQEPNVRITTMGPQGVQVEHKPFREVFHGLMLCHSSQRPTCPDDREFDVDLDCGAQRWRGPQSVAAVRKALARCGVAREAARKVVAEAVKAARSG